MIYCSGILCIIGQLSQFAKCHGGFSAINQTSKLTSAGFLYALGQSFLPITRVTAMLTYASYLDRKQSGPVRDFHRSHEHLGIVMAG